jgi:transcriptional regulator with XRE-family HTH domain
MAMPQTLRAWRVEQMLSIRRLAALSGTSNKTIVQIENGRQTPTFATIEKISRVLRVEPREVTEFVLALSERARAPIAEVPLDRACGRHGTHVLCISAVASFLTVSRRLLETERYGVTTMIGVPATVEQIACIRPEIVILDFGMDAPRMLELIQSLRSNANTALLPIIVTGRDRRRLEEILAELNEDSAQLVTVAPFNRDLRELLAAVESPTDGEDIEQTG